MNTFHSIRLTVSDNAFYERFPGSFRVVLCCSTQQAEQNHVCRKERRIGPVKHTTSHPFHITGYSYHTLSNLHHAHHVHHIHIMSILCGSCPCQTTPPDTADNRMLGICHIICVCTTCHNQGHWDKDCESH